MEMIENRTFDEIKLGDTASLVRTLSREDIDLFAIMSGDVNPAHVDEDYAKGDLFHTIIGHGVGRLADLNAAGHQAAWPWHDLSWPDAVLSPPGDRQRYHHSHRHGDGQRNRRAPGQLRLSL